MFNSGNDAEVETNAEESRGQKGRQGSAISRQFPKINRQMTWSKYKAGLKKLKGTRRGRLHETQRYTQTGRGGRGVYTQGRRDRGGAH